MVGFHPLTVPRSDCARLVRAFFLAKPYDWKGNGCHVDRDPISKRQ